MKRYEDVDDGQGVIGYRAWLTSGPRPNRKFPQLNPLAIGSTVTPVHETRSAAPCCRASGGSTHGAEKREEAQRAAFEIDSKLTSLERRAWQLRHEEQVWKERRYEVPRAERRAREDAGDHFVEWTTTGRAVMSGLFPRNRTLEEVGLELGVTISRAHQLVAAAKRKGAL